MLDQIAFLKHFCSTLWEYSPDTRQVKIYHDDLFPELCDRQIDYPEFYRLHLEHYIHREDCGI